MQTKPVVDAIESRRGMLAGLSDAIWDYAETLFTEKRSAAALCEALRSEGFTVTEGVAGLDTAFTGSFGSGRPIIGFLGEYDALYGMSQTADVVCEEPLVKGAPGHGCGHNLLGVGSLAAAIAVKEYLKSTGRPGTVVYFGTPGEEGGSGKAFMAREGVFGDLDAALTWHPYYINQVRTNSSLANIQACFRFRGRSAHASAVPHMGRSALDGLELMNVGVNFMREHVTPDVRVHYAVTDTGGRSPNVVQASAEAIYLCRANSIDRAQKVYEWVCDIARGAALMTQTEVEIVFMKACSNIIQNNVLERVLDDSLFAVPMFELTEEEAAAKRAFRDTVPLSKAANDDFIHRYGDVAVETLKANCMRPFYNFPVHCQPSDEVSPASTDVGDVSWVCPTAQLSIATQSPHAPGHSWQVVAQGKDSVSHKGMLFAGEVLASAAIRLMEEPGLLEKAKEEFTRRVGKKGYVCPIPRDVKPQTM